MRPHAPVSTSASQPISRAGSSALTMVTCVRMRPVRKIQRGCLSRSVRMPSPRPIPTAIPRSHTSVPPGLSRREATRYPGEPPDSGGEHARAERPPDAGPRGPDARPRRRAQPYAAPQRPPAGLAEPGARAALQPGGDRRRYGRSGDRCRGGRARRAGRPGREVPARRRLSERRLRALQVRDPLLPRGGRRARRSPARGTAARRRRAGLQRRDGAHAAAAGAHQPPRLGRALPARARRRRLPGRCSFHRAGHGRGRRHGASLRGRRRVIEFAAGEVAVDEILVGAGRAPNVERLGLESVGVQYDAARGVVVNDRLQTTNPCIYAAGDVCMQHKFTHMADAAARIVIQNTLFLGRKKLSALHVPWCTYTDPEIAHVGMYERDAARQGIAVDTFVTPLSTVDRAIADGEEEGFVKVHVKKGTDRILGATIVARHAGEMLNELTLAMVGRLGLATLANVIHPYPTQADAIRKTADSYNTTRLTPSVKTEFQPWLAWTR